MNLALKTSLHAKVRPNIVHYLYLVSYSYTISLSSTHKHIHIHTHTHTHTHIECAAHHGDDQDHPQHACRLQGSPHRAPRQRVHWYTLVIPLSHPCPTLVIPLSYPCHTFPKSCYIFSNTCYTFPNTCASSGVRGVSSTGPEAVVLESTRDVPLPGASGAPSQGPFPPLMPGAELGKEDSIVEVCATTHLPTLTHTHKHTHTHTHTHIHTHIHTHTHTHRHTHLLSRCAPRPGRIYGWWGGGPRKHIASSFCL
jgi:hypothetical protein